MNKIKRQKTEKIWFVIFAVYGAAVAIFELWQAAGFALLHDFLRPYAFWIALLALFIAAAVIFASRRGYLVSLILTVTGSVGLSAIGYALSHPAQLADEYFISGVDPSVFWKYFAPSLLLTVPAIALFVIGLRQKKAEEEAKPYEKQF